MQENVSLFDVWMQQESALVQEVAKSFGETMCLNHLLKTVIPRAEVAAKYHFTFSFVPVSNPMFLGRF